MLPSSPHVKQVYLEEGVLEAANPGTLIMDCSTIDPATSKAVSGAAEEKGVSKCEGCVTNSEKFVFPRLHDLLTFEMDVLGSSSAWLMHLSLVVLVGPRLVH